MPDPTSPTECIRLAGGREIVIRRITPQDSSLLAEGFARLSAESRKLRFLAPKSDLSSSELRYLTEVDGHRHEAIGAIDPITNHGIAVARFVREEQEPTRAEVAVTVADEWQRHGVGSLLLSRLSERARDEGITCFTALVASDNRSVRDLLSHIGGQVRTVGIADGAAQYEVELPPRGLGDQLRDLLRSAASGQLRSPPALWHELRALIPVALQLPEQRADAGS